MRQLLLRRPHAVNVITNPDWKPANTVTSDVQDKIVLPQQSKLIDLSFARVKADHFLLLKRSLMMQERPFLMQAHELRKQKTRIQKVNYHICNISKLKQSCL